MKAQEVLRRYAAGERNFCNANLRGANFKGQILSGADFSGADIRGASFNNATVRQANFTNTRAGLPQFWVMVQLFLKLIMIAITVTSQVFLGVFAAVLLSESLVDPIAGYVYLVLILAAYFAVSLQGFTVRTFGSILTAFAIAITSVVFSNVGTGSVEWVG